MNPPPNSSSSTPIPMLTASLAAPLSELQHTTGPSNMLGEIAVGYTLPLSLPAPPPVSVNLGTPLHQPLLQNELPLLRTPRVEAVESPCMEVHACMGATVAACVRTDTCMDASANKNSPVGLHGSVQPTLQEAAVAELGSSTTTGDGRPVQPMTAQAKVLQSPASSPSLQSTPSCHLAAAVTLGPATGRNMELSSSPVADVLMEPGAAAPLRSPPSSPTLQPTLHSTPTKLTNTPLRRSGRHFTSADGSSATDECSLSKAMRRQAERNLDPPTGTPCNKSFLSFSDSRISSSLNNVGIKIGKNDNDVCISVGVLKHMEIDRLKVSPKCSSPLPYPETEEEEPAAAYDGAVLFHLVGVGS